MVVSASRGRQKKFFLSLFLYGFSDRAISAVCRLAEGCNPVDAQFSQPKWKIHIILFFSCKKRCTTGASDSRECMFVYIYICIYIWRSSTFVTKNKIHCSWYCSNCDIFHCDFCLCWASIGQLVWGSHFRWTVVYSLHEKKAPIFIRNIKPDILDISDNIPQHKNFFWIHNIALSSWFR